VCRRHRLTRIWQYDIKRDSLTEVATFDPALFTLGSPGFLTQDEESSGIIDAGKILGKGWYLLDAQVHKPNPDAELVEYGQLLALYVPSKDESDDDDHDEDDDDD